MPLLFSYGTLQQNAVQLATFGRLLPGRPDALVGFERSSARIEDPAVAAALGETYHVTVVSNGSADSRVNGMVLEVTDAELAAADEYERDASYRRIIATLASGAQAWVYVHTPVRQSGG